MNSDAPDIRLDVAGVELHGNLTRPARGDGIVVFAHGSGSSRHSPRNQRVARTLQAAGLGTLLFDLLTPEEERIDAISAAYRFDIELLADRLCAATEWLLARTPAARVGYFGASTGAAAALIAASRLTRHVHAVVSRGGRPDLAGAALGQVAAPTLLLVGEHDPDVLRLNREALAKLHCTKKLVVIPNATHLFVEPGTLDQAADEARDWFAGYLGPAEPGAGE